jgi:hypothetical protein
MAAEMVNGAKRTILLTPRLGEAARQVSVFTGSALILTHARAPRCDSRAHG